MSNLSFNDYVSRHEQVLKDLLNHADIPALQMKEAVQYVMFSGGKRLRPLLVYLCGAVLDIPLRTLDIIAAAIELTHCYSLVHDDLPAMDNDDQRRGKPSCHRAFDEATAILVGDGLQAFAIEVLLDYLPESLSMPQVVAVTQTLVKASGLSGMVSGQSLDLLELKNPSLTETMLCNIHQLKTGKLMTACINMALAAGHPTPPITKHLREFAHHLGLVFQMQDDYLDKYSSQQLGKNRSSDTENNKTTFATQYPQEALCTLIEQHFTAAIQALTSLSPPVNARSAEALCDFLKTLQQRHKY